MTLQRFQTDQLTATPWKNGGGVTREIACYPANAGLDDFQWRLSLAHVASDGPFSAFPDVDRVITLLEGAGMHLRSTDGGIDHALEPLEPFAFPGDADVYCRLTGVACDDFNVMTRRGVMRADVGLVCNASTLKTSPHGALLAIQGEWLAYVGPNLPDHTLTPGEGMWWADEPIEWFMTPGSPDATLLAVHIWPAGGAAALYDESVPGGYVPYGHVPDDDIHPQP